VDLRGSYLASWEHPDQSCSSCRASCLRDAMAATTDSDCSVWMRNAEIMRNCRSVSVPGTIVLVRAAAFNGTRLPAQGHGSRPLDSSSTPIPITQLANRGIRSLSVLRRNTTVVFRPEREKPTDVKNLIGSVFVYRSFVLTLGFLCFAYASIRCKRTLCQEGEPRLSSGIEHYLAIVVLLGAPPATVHPTPALCILHAAITTSECQ